MCIEISAYFGGGGRGSNILNQTWDLILGKKDPSTTCVCMCVSSVLSSTGSSQKRGYNHKRLYTRHVGQACQYLLLDLHRKQGLNKASKSHVIRGEIGLLSSQLTLKLG